VTPKEAEALSIEQLGLEVRASQQRPSMINGAWNPEVKSALEDRLRKRSVNLDELINWNVRGSVSFARCTTNSKSTWKRYR